MSDSKKGGAIAREIFTREVHYSEPISTETSSDSEESTLVWLLNQPLFWIAIGSVAIALITDNQGQAPVIINNEAPPPIIINNN